jgi:non-heme chloroperoxidase
LVLSWFVRLACLALIVAGCGIGPINRRTFQTTDGVALSFLEAGQEHARHSDLTIALITGWSMPAAIWQKQLEQLGRSYHTLALDLRGQGESAVPEIGYTAERRATDVREFIEPFSNVLLIGWSLGAIEALQYVNMFGDRRLAGLVLVDSSVGEEPPPPSGNTFEQLLRKDRDKALNEFVRAIFAHPPAESELDDLLRSARRLPLEASISLLSEPFERAHWKRIAHGFSKPLLYIVTPQFEEQASNLQKNRPETEIHIFPDAGHALFVDEPERFNALIMNFAATLYAR